jgi:hypothetical protein
MRKNNHGMSRKRPVDNERRVADGKNADAAAV